MPNARCRLIIGLASRTDVGLRHRENASLSLGPPDAGDDIPTVRGPTATLLADDSWSSRLVQELQISEDASGARPAGHHGATGLLRRLVVTVTSQRWLLALCFANALGCLVVAVRYLGSLEGVLDAGGQVITGDFLNFYMGGRMILAGDGGLLYDLQAQQQARTGIAGPDYPNVHWYNYPPAWAIALAPISALPYVWAFYVYDLLMLAAMVGTLWLLSPLLPELRRRWPVTVLAVVFFHPIIRNIIGGQNTVLTLFLLAGAYTGLRTNRRILCGMFLGLLLYKPQFALPLLLILLVRGDLVSVLSAGVVGTGHYLIGALFCGPSWPIQMLEFLGSFRAMEARLNAATHISLLSACDYSLAWPWSRVAAGILMLAAALVLLRVARRFAATEPAFAVYWGLAVTGTLLLSPHTQYYDAGILVLPVILGLDYLLQRGRQPTATLRIALLAGYVLFPIYEVSPALHFQPLLLWPVLTFVWLAKVLSTLESSRNPQGVPRAAAAVNERSQRASLA
ncbi:MAG: glycosyltransferase family 87 protein [Planctomycetota bacterium]|jgi:hypothetical protein